MKDVLNVELTVTQQCNLRCSYCSESGKYEATTCEDILPEFYKFVDNILVSDYFKNNYKILHIAFWGGEPTLRPDLIMDVVNRYKDITNVKFMIYTNGFNIKQELKDLIVSLKSIKVGNHPKFLTQISYDGLPVHDIKRLTVRNTPSSKEVRESIWWAKDSEIPFSIKSVITIDTFKYMSEVYTDIRNLLSGSKSYGGSGYFPTTDYFNTPEEEVMEEYINDLKTSLKKIASIILTDEKNGVKVTEFKWFENSKAHCSAGINLFSINTDGRIYACHGCLYTPTREDHYVGHINDGVDKLAIATTKHAPCQSIQPKECKSCLAVFCVRCNAMRYSTSTKETYEERWKDYANKPHLCKIFQEAGTVARAFKKLKEKTNVSRN